MARTLSPELDERIASATLKLLGERGFAGATIEAIARRADVGKPAVYRRFPDKASLVVSVIGRQLPQLEVPDLGNTHAELRQAMDRGFPSDAGAYLRLIGGLIAEEARHPELIGAFRDHILLPRRALVIGLIARGQSRRDIRAEVIPEMAVDGLAGQLLARAFAGIDTGRQWRRKAFDVWFKGIEREQEK